MIKYYLEKKSEILEVEYEGIIVAEDIVKHTDYLLTNPNLPNQLKILTDARQAQYKISIEELNGLLKLIKKSLHKFSSIRDAFIHKNPKETAFSVLIEQKAIHKNYSHKVFVTKEAAMDWLNDPF